MDAASTYDNELVARAAAQQDPAAFGELVRRHQSHVRNFLRKLCRDFDLADDLAQDCFMHAWDKLHTFSGQGSFIGWLLKVAYTTFLQSKRKSKRYGEVLDQVGQESQAASSQHSVLADETGPRFRAVAARGDDLGAGSPMHNPFGRLQLVSMKDIAERN